MSKPDPATKSPAQQASEKFGNVQQPQVTDHTVKETDRPRGSEANTRGASHGQR